MPPDLAVLRQCLAERTYLLTAHASDRAAQRGIVSREIEEITMNRQRCLFCQGELELQRVSRAQEYEGRWLVIENLPALVCRQCGERFYTPDVHDLVVALIQGQARPVRTDTIEVYDAARIA